MSDAYVPRRKSEIYSTGVNTGSIERGNERQRAEKKKLSVSSNVVGRVM